VLGKRQNLGMKVLTPSLKGLDEDQTKSLFFWLKGKT
jgi:hypothetical protein